jgi:hypothetical protein
MTGALTGVTSLGINTSSPAEALSVIGNVTTSGTITASSFTGDVYANVLSATTTSLVIDEMSLGLSNAMIWSDASGLLTPSEIVTTDGIDISTNGTITAGTFSGNLSWSNLTDVPLANTSTAGIVQLSTSTTSTLTTQAPTLSALKSVQDDLDSLETLHASDTAALTGQINSLDASKLDLAGGVMTGAITGVTSLGINTSSPTEALSVIGNVTTSGSVTASSFSGNVYANMLSATTTSLVIDEMSLGTSNTLVWSDGLGLLTPSTITTDGSEISTTGNVQTGDLSVTGDISATGTLTENASDRRLKTNIHPLENTLDTIKKLGGYTFDWRDDINGLPPSMRGSDIGLLVQDLDSAGLDICTTLAPFDNNGAGVSKSGQHYKTIRYNTLHALWAEAFKQQQETIETLQKTVQSLLERVAALE